MFFTSFGYKKSAMYGIMPYLRTQNIKGRKKIVGTESSLVIKNRPFGVTH